MKKRNKKYLYSFFSFLLLSSFVFVSAQSNKSNAGDSVNSLQERREERMEAMEEKKEEMQEKREEMREERQERACERTQKRYRGKTYKFDK
jgi:hypothetical protein